MIDPEQVRVVVREELCKERQQQRNLWRNVWRAIRAIEKALDNHFRFSSQDDQG